MKNLWNDKEAEKCQNDLDLRVYTSNLLGQSDELVLHGGGNTSVKSTCRWGRDTLCQRFRLGLGFHQSRRLCSCKDGPHFWKWQSLKELSDTDMVTQQKAAMTDTSAPNPSVEAILHALIPFKVVDHTHADAIVTISNSKNGQTVDRGTFPQFSHYPLCNAWFYLGSEDL